MQSQVSSLVGVNGFVSMMNWEKTDSIVCAYLVEQVAPDQPHCFSSDSENAEVSAQSEQLWSHQQHGLREK